MARDILVLLKHANFENIIKINFKKLYFFQLFKAIKALILRNDPDKHGFLTCTSSKNLYITKQNFELKLKKKSYNVKNIFSGSQTFPR